MTEGFFFLLGWVTCNLTAAAASWWARTRNQKRFAKLESTGGLGRLVESGRHMMVCSTCEEPRAVHNPNLPADWVCSLCVEEDLLSDEEKEDQRQLAKLQNVLRGEKPEGVP